ncbi:Nucleolar and coiled-body phosphoprotein [Echinococcus granulosus]|uniref:Nucleolar and coiled-body phosphoprotein n=1 Tax=Echinococcus granulosus TaxID=6210 RepID=W6UFL6_ECHGR|nr:Nucleolar and coiled-body phosphoprotein [Echinococcus granulosus]EUB59898.1 Nucleolar and coiled-body phosphoprotein [Echinococcus granulosus]
MSVKSKQESNQILESHTVCSLKNSNSAAPKRPVLNDDSSSSSESDLPAKKRRFGTEHPTSKGKDKASKAMISKITVCDASYKGNVGCSGAGKSKSATLSNVITDADSTPKTPSAVTGTGTPNSAKQRLPFRRVEDDAYVVPPELADNSFAAKRGAQGSWGERADMTLKFTRGKDFRHEKTKKKRGTYNGGIISTAVCSFKFNE